MRVAAGGMSGTRLRKVFAYIEEHFSEDIGLESLASIAGFSANNFDDVLKSETGFTPTSS